MPPDRGPKGCLPLHSDHTKGSEAGSRSLGQFVRRVHQAFLRPRVTIGIIAMLLVLFIAGLLIPQKALFPSPQQYEQWNADHPVLAALKLNDIYVAPVTIAFLALFFLNLVAVLVPRIPVTLRRAYLLDRDRAVAAGLQRTDAAHGLTLAVDATPAGGAQLADRTAAFFRKRHWHVLAGGGGALLAVRNRFSPLGFLLFHVSFLLCLVGGLLVVYTRFSGSLLLTEGEAFHADMARIKVIDSPKAFHALPDLGITLLRVAPRYEGSTSTGLSVAMRVQYFTESFDAVAGINEPVRRGALSLLPRAVGISPLFVLKDRGGRTVTDGFFTLNVLKGTEDSFQFPDLPYTIAVLFYPDFVEKDGKPASLSQEIRNPVFHIRVLKDGKMLYDGLRKPGEAAPFDAFELSFGELRYWVDVLLVREYGTVPLAAGFLLGAAGLVLRLLFPQRSVGIRVEEREAAPPLVHLGGSGEYYPQTFRMELARLAAELAGDLGGVVEKERTA